jgi:hypothetical protein
MVTDDDAAGAERADDIRRVYAGLAQLAQAIDGLSVPAAVRRRLDLLGESLERMVTLLSQIERTEDMPAALERASMLLARAQRNAAELAQWFTDTGERLTTAANGVSGSAADCSDQTRSEP